jgi:segregation and condensation protein A
MLAALPPAPLSPLGPYPVRLDVFEGPLDLLIYLIRRHELNIHDIPIAFVTEQFTGYLKAMETLDIEVAGEYLVMAATLVQIKSKMLLPMPAEGVEGEGEDPRAGLVEKLLEYERFKQAAEELERMEAHASRMHARPREAVDMERYEIEPGLDADSFGLLKAFREAMERLAARPAVIEGEEYTIEEKAAAIEAMLLAQEGRPLLFGKIFERSRSLVEAVVFFLALLELMRLGKVRARQGGRFEEIFIYAAPVETPEGGGGIIEFETKS